MNHWLVRFTPRKPKGRWSAKNRVRAERLIAEGRMRPAGLKEVDAAKANGRSDTSYESQGKIAVPDDLTAAFDDAPEAKRFFEALDSANRYAILYRLHHAKSDDARTRLIEKFVAMCARGET